MTQAAVPTGQTEVPPEEQANPPLNRREFLNIAWLSSLGFLTLTLAGGAVIFGIPRFREGEFGGMFTVGRVGDLPGPEAAPANFPKVKLWISNTPEGVTALYKVCVHLGCIYGWSDQEFKFICPCHGSQYAHNGDYILGPAPRSLDRFVITIEDENGNVLAQTPADGGPVPLPDNPNAIVRVNTGAKILGEVHG
ncbi:MAG: Rieske 2Fe-2S domain-containing protein [Anaerolineales bacterium]|nr:Rieske 2Fe-2S domain-containing protein [Anaerolineales bacterium]MBX3005776.1 Rieske 2Fe-2S domain-containing protein [Anaerolineales bacterium]